jgi:hypothetical protein
MNGPRLTRLHVGFATLVTLIAACDRSITEPEPPLKSALHVASTGTAPATVTHTLLTAGNNTINQKVYTTAAISPAPNTLITVAVLGHRSTSNVAPPLGAPPPATLSGGGMTAWTQVATTTFDFEGDTPLKRLTIYRAMSAAPGSGPITVTFPNNVSNSQWIVSQWTGVEASGVNGAGAIGQIGSSRGEAVSGLTVPLTAFGNPNNVAYGVFGVSSGALAITPGAGFTELSEQPSTESPPSDLMAEGAFNVNMIAATWTNLNGGVLGVEIRAAATGGVSTVPPAPSSTTISHTLLTAGNNTINQKVYTTAAISPAPNTLITVAVLGHRSTVGVDPPLGAPSSVTLSGGGMTAWTPVATTTFDLEGATPLKRLTIFRAMSAAPGSGPLTITFSNNVSNCQWIVSLWNGVETSGVNGAGAIGQTGSGRGDAVNGLTVPLAAFGNPNNVAYGVFGVRSQVLAVTASAGFTELSEQPSGETAAGDLQAEWATNRNTIAATWSTLNGGALAVEIRAAAAAPPPPTGGARVTGVGAIVATPGSPRQTFDFEATDAPGGRLLFTDFSIVRQPSGSAATLTVAATVPGTRITFFTRTTAACVTFGGTGRVDTGELVSFSIGACNNSSPGVDDFTIRVPSLLYQASGTLTEGAITVSGGGAPTPPPGVTRVTCVGCAIGSVTTTTPGSDRQEFDFDATSAPSGTLDITDYSVVHQPAGTVGRMIVHRDAAATGVTSFSRTSAACVRFGGTGKLDTGEFWAFFIDACDDPRGPRFDTFTVTLPDRVAPGVPFTRSGTLGEGDIVIAATTS